MTGCIHEGWDGYGNCPACGLAQESDDGRRIREGRPEISERLIRQSGPTIVVRAYQGGGDVHNAFVVLAQVVGRGTAEVQVRREAERQGEDPALVMAAAEPIVEPTDTAKVTVTIEVDAIVADPSDTASVMAALGDFTNVSRANDEPGVIGWQLMKVEVARRYRTRGEPDGKGVLAGEGELMTGVEIGGTVHKEDPR